MISVSTRHSNLVLSDCSREKDKTGDKAFYKPRSDLPIHKLVIDS